MLSFDFIMHVDIITKVYSLKQKKKKKNHVEKMK